MIKIALDATYAAHPDPTGIGIYCRRLIEALAALSLFQSSPRISSSPEDAPHYRLLLSFRPGPFLRRVRKRHWPPACSCVPLFESGPLARNVTLFHGLNQRLPQRYFPARVVTIHDLFPLTSRGYSTPEFQSHFGPILRDALARADRIIAVSGATRHELLRHTAADEDRIRVVHHGIDPPVLPGAAEQEKFRQRTLGLQPGERFFLSVGAIQARKNTANIVRALEHVPRIRLVIAGGDGFGADRIVSLIENTAMGGRVMRLGHTSRDQLRLLYSTATALVFPSLEEGFGFPILEAMSYGLPVITSNCSSMPEVAGDAALLVNPMDVSQISQAMFRIAEDEELAADLADRGRERAGQFTWEKCAAETWKVYGEALGGASKA